MDVLGLVAALGEIISADEALSATADVRPDGIRVTSLVPWPARRCPATNGTRAHDPALTAIVADVLLNGNGSTVTPPERHLTSPRAGDSLYAARALQGSAVAVLVTRRRPRRRPFGDRERRIIDLFHAETASAICPDLTVVNNTAVQLKLFFHDNMGNSAGVAVAPGVNNLGTMGRWAFAELTEIYRIESDFEAKLEESFNAMIDGAAAARV